MTNYLVVIALVVVLVGLITSLLMHRKSRAASQELAEAKAALAIATADYDARQGELRKQIDEVRGREDEAKAKVTETENRYNGLTSELKTALEEKGRFQNEATRVEEVKATIAERDAEIRTLNTQIADLAKAKTEALKDAQAANQRATDMIAKEREAQAEILKAKQEQITQLSEFIGEARKVLTTEFKALSADALKDASAQLVKTADSLIEKHGEKTTADVKLHQQHIETMLKPVEETIKRLDKHVEESDLARTRAEALLDDQVKRLAGASESLTNALRKPVVRGSWGEMTLENALENAGLEPEIDYILQHYTDAEDGQRRTDAVINLPKGRKLIVDSKNLMESYIALANATDEKQKALLADVHAKSLKRHIKSLSSKEYWRRYEGLDCVILFVPHDGMYHAAIQDEAELIREACEKRVFISNPMSLIPLLKAIRYVLDQERLNKNAEEIKNVGAELYAEVTRFAANMSTIGDRLQSTVRAYNEAIPGLDRYIVSKSRKLKQLGSGKGAEAELPETIDLDTRSFSSRELRTSNRMATDEFSQPGLALAAGAEETGLSEK
ncbi:MAG: DNA recombination protein RmuC [Terracidiphilus sp.]|jgi:DNA recombination protein RmuC